MSDTKTLVVPTKRLVFIDNLRWSAISMVVVIHAAVTYSGIGSWYVRDRVHTSRPAVIALATYQSLQHAAAMGLLFGIAGYFASSALERRSVRSFLRERSYRLGLPLLLYTIVIGPLTEYYIARSWHARPGGTLWQEWLAHAQSGQIFSGSGPLWFCLVLLAFSLVFAAVEVVWPRRRDIISNAIPGPRSFILFTLAMTTLTFLLGAVTPGVDTILNVVVHDFPQYPLMFIAGVLAQRGNWLLRFPRCYGPVGAMGGLVIGLIYWFVLLEVGGAFRGQLAAFGGGWHWQALAMDLWRSAMCLSLCIGLITLYRDHFNKQGRIARFLTRNAFGVYVFHPPILIAITVALTEWPVENLLKFLIASVAAVVTTFLFVGLVARRTPLLRAIL
jgi:hypothetical protein